MDRQRLLVPDVDLEQWERWAQAHGGLPLRFESAEQVPPGLRALCEPEGFTYEPGDEDGLTSSGAWIAVGVRGVLSSGTFGSLDGAVAFSIDLENRIAHHHQLFLPKGANRFGIGRLYVQRAALLYLALDVRSVKIRAEQIGKYAWSTVGFSFADDETRGTVVAAVREFAAELDIFDDEIPDFEHPWELGEHFTDEEGDELMVPCELLNEILSDRYRGMPITTGGTVPSTWTGKTLVLGAFGPERSIRHAHRQAPR